MWLASLIGGLPILLYPVFGFNVKCLFHQFYEKFTSSAVIVYGATAFGSVPSADAQKPEHKPAAKKLFAILLAGVIVLAILGAILYQIFAKHPKGGVVTNGHGCSRIGVSILDKGGSAVDAAIAALFCEGVSMPQSMGLGGGFLMTIYRQEDGLVKTLNARETAPAGATEDMFKGNGGLSTKGGLSVAVPGELRGYWMAYKEYGGKVAWRDLVQPTIDLCKNGILVTPYLEGMYKNNFDQLYKDPGLREAFIDPSTNKTYLLNQHVKRLRLAKTLETIALEGGDALNNGSLTEQLAKDIRDANGIITADDLRNYKPQWQDPIRIQLPFGDVLYTSPLPGSGLILGFIMNILNGFLDYSKPHWIINWQRIIESFKYGYGRRTDLGDTNFVDMNQLLVIIEDASLSISGVPVLGFFVFMSLKFPKLIANLTSSEYADLIRKTIYDNVTFQDPGHYGANWTQPEDHGTAHISVLAPNGDAVSVTSTINLYFGAGFMSLSTGIILNDEMDDFSSPNLTSSFDIPPSPANYISPGKRPLSSMCPSIIVGKNNQVDLVVGAAGGTKITTSVALVIIKTLWFNYTVQDAVSDRRLHHQLFPMKVLLEEPYENDLQFVESIHKIGHDYEVQPSTGFSAITAISKKGSSIGMATDRRRPGESSPVYG